MHPFVSRRLGSSLAVAIAPLLLPITLGAQGVYATLAERYAEIRRLAGARDTTRAVAVAESLYASYAHYPNVVYYRALAMAAAGRRGDALAMLDRLMAWDARYARTLLADSLFAPMREAAADRDVPRRAERAALPLAGARVVATLAESDLIPEGTAWDPISSRILVGSLNKYAILAIAGDGSVRDLVPRGANGLRSIAGIHVDAPRRVVWATSNARYETPTDSASAALYAFDVRTGAMRRRVALPGPGVDHFLNDVTTTADGTVYVTDSRVGVVWRLRPGGTSLERFERAGRFGSPNGITITGDGRHLFVADLDHIRVVPLAGGEPWRLAVPDSIDISGIDGLAWAAGMLVAHHPGAFGRVARYALAPSLRAITGRTLLEANTPDVRTATTGEVVGRDYVFIGNSQIDRMNARTIYTGAPMQPVRIYRTTLMPKPPARVVAALSARDSVAVLDAHTLDPVATLAVGRTPHEIATSPDGRRAYVADARDTTISVVALGALGDAPAVVARWPLPDSLRVHDVAAGTDGRRVWGASAERGTVLELDAATGRLVRRHAVRRPGGWNLDVVRAQPTVLVAHLEGGAVSLLDGQTGRVREVPTAEGEIDAVATMDGREVWAVNARTGMLSVIDALGGRVVHSVKLSESLSRVAMTPDGRTALVVSASDSSLVALDVRTRNRRGAVPLAGGPKVLALSPDGRRAYVTHPERGRVTMVDVPSMTVLRSVELAGTPDGVAVLEPRR